MDMMGKGEEKALQRAPPDAQEKGGGGPASYPIPSHPMGMLRCPYSQRRGRAGRLSLGSQIFWMRLCVSSMGIFKTKVFLRSASTLVRLRGEEGGEEKRRKEGKTKITIKKAFCCSRRFRGWFEEAAAALSAASRSLVKALRRRRRRKRRAGASGHKSRQERHKYGRCALGGSEGESRR